ncbi:LysR substrate-binding domain-containing protein [Massilia sp. LXY-6]|uniref:LysR substrate-binding domain-containing protein n=1 Tax=Massilia sp. LXY-6 TaxID=3379823 RepID=UPI003EE03124
MTNIPTELLRTFVTVVSTKSFTRAGEVVGRTQAAVSLQIRRLEDLLDGQLFVRGSYSVRLTDQGSTLFGYAKRILALNDEAISCLRRPVVAGCIQLGAPHEYADSLLPVILGQFARTHPSVTLEVTCDLSKNLLGRMDKGEFDLVIALHDDPDDTSGSKIASEPMIWVTSPDHAHHEQRPLPLVVAPQPCIYRRRMLQTLNRLELPSRITYTSSNYSGITAAVCAGLGVTVLTASTVPQGVRILGEREGFPEMGHLDVRLHTALEQNTEAVQHLADYIAKSLA